MAIRRLLCETCSIFLVPWGKTSSGKKRFFCKECGTTRIFVHKKKVDLFELFRQYILWGFTYKAISSLSGYSIQYLTSKFHQFLSQKPPDFVVLDQSNL